MDTPELAPSTQPPAKVGFWKGIFHHPNFNAICGVATLVSAIFAVYCWRDSIRKPELTYYIGQTRTPIVQKGQINELSVNFGGESIKGDLSAAHIQIWNAGREPIHREDILKSITINTTSNAPIFQVILKQSREVSGITYKPVSNGTLNKVELDWKILEKGDGADIQLIYGGDVKMPFEINGVVVGQKNISQYRYVKDETEKTVLFFTVCSGCFTALLSLVNSILEKRQSKAPKVVKWAIVSLLVVFLIVVFLCTWNICAVLLSVKPPFGF